MADDPEGREIAKKALEGLVNSIARASARVSGDMGVEFDVDDPRVARWIMLATFEGIFRQSSQAATKDLLAIASKASAGITPRRKKKGHRGQLLVTWDDLVASVEACPGRGA
jgi:hypothetical protein